MKLNDATRIYVGDTPAKKVFIGDTEVWSDVEQRYFRTNSGTTDGIQLSSEIILSYPASITFDIVIDTDVIGTIEKVTDGLTGVDRLDLNWRGDSDVMEAVMAGSWTIDGVPTASLSPDDAIHRVEFSLGSGLARRFGTIGNRYTLNSFGFSGEIANVRIFQSGILTNSWAVDDNSDTIKDSVGGNHGTVINGNPSDWELFTKVGNTWVGETSGRVIPIAYE